MTIKDFSAYRLTALHAKFSTEAPEIIGCVGEFTIETEMREITKKCEGKVVESVSKIDGMTGLFRGHMKVDVLRKVYGLTNENLKPGIYSYGEGSVPAEGQYTAEVLDLLEENKKMLAIPKMVNTSGLKITHVNGEDEVAEIEINYRLLPDEFGQYYYEAFESEVSDAGLKGKWHTAFTPSMARKTGI